VEYQELKLSLKQIEKQLKLALKLVVMQPKVQLVLKLELQQELEQVLELGLEQLMVTVVMFHLSSFVGQDIAPIRHIEEPIPQCILIQLQIACQPQITMPIAFQNLLNPRKFQGQLALVEEQVLEN
jgi:hypothetical protein